MTFIVINGICYLGASGMRSADLGYGQRRHRLPRAADRRAQRGHRLLTYSFFANFASHSGSLSSFVLGNIIGYKRDRRRCADRRRCERHLEEISHRRLHFLGYGIAVAILFFVYPLTKQQKTAGDADRAEGLAAPQRRFYRK